jgi:uncharacterized membrane protein
MVPRLAWVAILWSFTRFPSGSGLAHSVSVPSGVLPLSSCFIPNAMSFLGGKPAALLFLWVFAAMFALWWWKTRGAVPAETVVTMYEPPSGITPAEAGTLVDGNVSGRDITATLVDLAIKGYIRIIERDETLLGHNLRDYTLQLLISRPRWQNLASHELDVLDSVFPLDAMVDGATQTETTLSNLKESFYIAVPRIREEIQRTLRSKKLYSARSGVGRAMPVAGLLLIAMPFFGPQLTSIFQLDDSYRLLVVSVQLILGFALLFGGTFGGKPVPGSRARSQCVGFKEFMSRVDSDRLKRMPPDTFEKYLPYAMAFGVEQYWARAFQGLVTLPLAWYVASGNTAGSVEFSSDIFCNALGSFSSSLSYSSGAMGAMPQAAAVDSIFNTDHLFSGKGGSGGDDPY